jgi:hypothetical protein
MATTEATMLWWAWLTFGGLGALAIGIIVAAAYQVWGD